MADPAEPATDAKPAAHELLGALQDEGVAGSAGSAMALGQQRCYGAKLFLLRGAAPRRGCPARPGASLGSAAAPRQRLLRPVARGNPGPVLVLRRFAYETLRNLCGLVRGASCVIGKGLGPSPRRALSAAADEIRRNEVRSTGVRARARRGSLPEPR